jgi:hypothetical protein
MSAISGNLILARGFLHNLFGASLSFYIVAQQSRGALAW